MSDKRKRYELKRKKRTKGNYKRPQGRKIEYRIIPTIDGYIQNPSVQGLLNLVKSFQQDSEFVDLFHKVIDDETVFNKITDLERGIIFYHNKKLIESISFIKRSSQFNTPISLHYYFLAAIERADLSTAYEILVSIEKDPKDFEGVIINIYRMMYGLASGLNSYAERVAYYSLEKDGQDFRSYNLILQVGSRTENVDLLIKSLTSKVGKDILSSLGTRQQDKIRNIFNKYLLKLLRERAL